MLSFILGPSASGRTHCLQSQMRSQVNQRRMLIIPEQVSFSTERDIASSFGSDANQIQVLSFTRLAHNIFKTCGGLAGERANTVSKLITMDLAVHEIKDKLERYAKSVHQPGFTKLLLKTADELKNSGFSPESFQAAVHHLPNGELKKKAQEFCDIFMVYDAKLTAELRDPLDDLERARKKAAKSNFFTGTQIYFDDFISFSSVQFKMITEMIQQTDVTFSICCEPKDPLFEPAQKTIRKLTAAATACGVDVQKPLRLPPGTLKPDALCKLERQILRSEPSAPANADGRVHTILASNEYDEMDAVLCQVLQLVRQGLRYNEIALLTRDLESYQSVLAGALKKYNIPYFMDEKACAQTLPLFQCCTGLLNTACRFQIGSLLQLLKSDLTKFSPEEIGQFENYLYTWNVDRKSIMQPFTQSPKGFDEQRNNPLQNQADLDRINRVRQTSMQAIDILKQAESSAQSLSNALLQALDLLGVKQCMSDQISQNADKPDRAEQIARQWDLLIQLLEWMVSAAKTQSISLNRFMEMFSIAANGMDVGNIPQTLDSLLIGSADRTVLRNIKAVFIFGANDGLFPFHPSFSGIFTSSDRISLAENDLVLSKPIEEWIEEERLLAYQAICSASEYVCVSARLGSISGDPYYPSEILAQLTAQFGDQITEYTSSNSILSLCQTNESAFLQLAFHYRDNTEDIATLNEYFKGLKTYQSRLNALEKISRSSEWKLTDSSCFQRNRSLRLSPSQTELYFKCPFAYFCKYGLSIHPVPTTKIKAPLLGSIIHYILEHVVAQENFMTLSPNELKSAIHQHLEIYLQKQLGGRENKTTQFLQVYFHTERQIQILCKNIQMEFSSSKYRPAAFELNLEENGDCAPIEIPLNNQLTATVQGKIDRVDTCQINGKTYLRIVDYKTGNKDFSFSDLYQGLNMQMLLYLFSILQNGQDKFKDVIPAGILYLPASGSMKKFILSERNPEQSQIDLAIQKGFRFHGLVLEDAANLQAMEQIPPGESGKFLPLRLSKSGQVHTSDLDRYLVTQIQMDQLFVFVREQIRNMCHSLLSGNIMARPLTGFDKNHHACDYCDYSAVCGHLPSGQDKKVEPLSKRDFFQKAINQIAPPSKISHDKTGGEHHDRSSNTGK